MCGDKFLVIVATIAIAFFKSWCSLSNFIYSQLTTTAVATLLLMAGRSTTPQRINGLYAWQKPLKRSKNGWKLF